MAPKAKKKKAEKRKVSRSPRTQSEPAAAKRSRREVRDNPGPAMGHNLNKVRDAALPLVKKFFNLQDAMDSDMAGYRKDFKDLYEEAANEIGMKKSLVVKEFKRLLRNKREEEKEMMMERAEADQVDMLRASLESLEEVKGLGPLGAWAVGQVKRGQGAQVEAEGGNAEAAGEEEAETETELAEA